MSGGRGGGERGGKEGVVGRRRRRTRCGSFPGCSIPCVLLISDTVTGTPRRRRRRRRLHLVPGEGDGERRPRVGGVDRVELLDGLLQPVPVEKVAHACARRRPGVAAGGRVGPRGGERGPALEPLLGRILGLLDAAAESAH